MLFTEHHWTYTKTVNHYASLLVISYIITYYCCTIYIIENYNIIIMIYIILYIICCIYIYITISLSLCYTVNTIPYSTDCFVSCYTNKQLVYRNTKTISVNRLQMKIKWISIHKAKANICSMSHFSLFSIFELNLSLFIQPIYSPK